MLNYKRIRVISTSPLHNRTLYNSRMF